MSMSQVFKFQSSCLMKLTTLLLVIQLLSQEAVEEVRLLNLLDFIRYSWCFFLPMASALCHSHSTPTSRVSMCSSPIRSSSSNSLALICTQASSFIVSLWASSRKPLEIRKRTMFKHGSFTKLESTSPGYFQMQYSSSMLTSLSLKVNGKGLSKAWTYGQHGRKRTQWTTLISLTKRHPISVWFFRLFCLIYLTKEALFMNIS